MWHVPGSAGLGLSVLSDTLSAAEFVEPMLAFKAHPKGLQLRSLRVAEAVS